VGLIVNGKCRCTNGCIPKAVTFQSNPRATCLLATVELCTVPLADTTPRWEGLAPECGLLSTRPEQREQQQGQEQPGRTTAIIEEYLADVLTTTKSEPCCQCHGRRRASYRHQVGQTGLPGCLAGLIGFVCRSYPRIDSS
jgi:hypothetical protein